MSAAHIYYCFNGLLGLGIAATLTAYTPFLQTIGLSLAEIALINSIFWFIIIVTELPTGMLADGKSRSYSLMWGAIFHAVGALVYFNATGFWSAALGEALTGIAVAFISGAGSAWIADALARENKTLELRKVYATNEFIRSVLFLGGGFVGSWIALWNHKFIWAPLIVTSILAAIFAKVVMNGQGEPLEYVSEVEAFKRAFAHLRRSHALIWLIGALIVFGAVVSFNHYWALYYLPQVGQKGLSWIWVVILLGAIGGAQWVRRMSMPQGGEERMFVFSILLCGLGLLGVAIYPSLYLSVPALFLHELGRGFFRPLTESFVQHRVQSSYRATFGSLQSFLGRMGLAIVPLVVYLLIKDAPNTSETITQVWLVCAILLILGSIGLWLTKPRPT